MTRPPPEPAPDAGRAPPPLPVDDGEEGDETLLDDEALGLLLDDDAEGDPLDDATSERDPIEESDLDVDLDAGEEIDWRDGTEDADEIESDEGNEGAEEYGWTADTEAPGVEEGDDVLAELRDERTSPEDDQEGGVDDDGTDELLEIDGVRSSRELDADDGDEGLELSGEDEIGGSLSYEQEARMMGASLPPLGDAYEASWIGPGEAVWALAGWDDVWCLGDDLHRLRGEELVKIGLPALAALGGSSVAVHPRRSERIVVGTLQGGALGSSDDGRTWSELLGWRRPDDPPGLHVAFEGAPDGARLWGRTRGGRLVRSDDDGGSWADVESAPALAFAAARSGGVAAVLARDDGFVVRWSRDGGSEWREAALDGAPAGTPGDAFCVAIGASRVAVGLEGVPDGLWVVDDPTGAVQALPWPSPSALELGAGDVLWVGTFLPAVDRGVLARDPDAAAAAVLDVGVARAAAGQRPPPEGESEGRIAAILSHGRGVFVASSVGMFLVSRRSGRG